jgi:hypothetical protein
MPAEILTGIEAKISSGGYATLADLTEAFAAASVKYESWEWEYVNAAFRLDEGYDLPAMTKERALDLLARYSDAALGLQNMILDDSKKEYDAFARISFGAGMSDEEAARDFEAVRGSAEKNSVVTKLMKEKEEITSWVERMRKTIVEA